MGSAVYFDWIDLRRYGSESYFVEIFECKNLVMVMMTMEMMEMAYVFDRMLDRTEHEAIFWGICMCIDADSGRNDYYYENCYFENLSYYFDCYIRGYHQFVKHISIC